MGGQAGFSGRTPGGPSRWSTRRTDDWHPLKPKLVVEIQYDHFTGDRFRHGTRFFAGGRTSRPGGASSTRLTVEAVKR